MPEIAEKPLVPSVVVNQTETPANQPIDIVTLLKTDPNKAEFLLDPEKRKEQITQINEELQNMGLLNENNVIKNTKQYTLEKMLEYPLDARNPNSLVALGGLFSTLYRQIFTGLNEKRLTIDKADFLTNLLNTTVKYKNLDQTHPNFGTYTLASTLTQTYPRTPQEASDVH